MKCFITRLCVSTLLRTLALKANAIALMITIAPVKVFAFLLLITSTKSP